MKLEDIFPYTSFRPGQKELAVAVYNACKGGKRIAMEAMSGFGKTAAVLSGSALAAEEDGLRIIYACRTKRQVVRALEETRRIQERILFRSTSLASKHDYCLQREKSSFSVSPETFKWYCNFNVSNNLCSYFLNLGILREKASRLAGEISRAVVPHPILMKESASLHICPYEIARLSLGDAKLIITTYHYLLEKTSRSILLGNTEQTYGRTIAVIDEAHNLHDFLRDICTHSLTISTLEQSIQDAGRLYVGGATHSLEEFAKRVKRFCSSHNSWYVNKQEFIDSIRNSTEITWLSELAFELSTCANVAWYSVATGRNLPSSILKVGDFLTNLLDSIDSEEWILVRSPECLFLTKSDASTEFAKLTTNLHALILMSGTINPSHIFFRSIGLGGGIELHKAEVNFAIRVRTLIDTSVTTRFKTRSNEMYSSIVGRIVAACNAAEAGVGVFAPSYAVLEPIGEILKTAITDRQLLLEERGMTSNQADDMMRVFKSNPSSLLLAVQGGRFSEGEDFPGDQMDISIVVGLSLPPPSPMLYAEYRQVEGSNRHEAYLQVSLLPALRKAFQSAGRHIRNPGKMGMVFLLDTRFAGQEVRSLMPSWLRADMIIGEFKPDEIERSVKEFFSGRSGG